MVDWLMMEIEGGEKRVIRDDDQESLVLEERGRREAERGIEVSEN